MDHGGSQEGQQLASCRFNSSSADNSNQGTCIMTRDACNWQRHSYEAIAPRTGRKEPQNHVRSHFTHHSLIG